jgi:MFS family permease
MSEANKMNARAGTKRPTLWTKDFTLCCLAGLFSAVVIQMLNVTLSPFANDMWNSKTLGGYLTSFFNIGSIVMAFFCGPLVDKKGRRNCIIAASILFFLPTLLCAYWPIPSVCLIARVLEGMAKGIVSVATASIVADVTPNERMSEGMGFFGLGNTLSMALGPWLGLKLTADKEYSQLFIVCALMYLMAGAAAVFINYEKDPDYQKKKEEKQKSPVASQEKGIWKLIEKAAILPSLNHTIYFASYAGVLVFITVYAQEILNLNSSQISSFYTIAAVSMLIIRLFAGKISDTYGPLTIVIPGHISVILMLVLLAYFSQGSYAIFMLCGVLYGVATATVMPCLNAVAVVDSPKERSGTANATFYFMQDFGILFASAFFGGVIDRAATAEAGYLQMFLISIGICVFSLTMSVLCFNDKSRAKRRAKYIPASSASSDSTES